MTDIIEDIPNYANPADYPMYQLSARGEIVTELRAVADNKRGIVAIVFNEMGESIKTRIADIDRNGIILAAGDDAERNQAAVSDPTAVCIAVAGRHVQFALTGLELFTHDGQSCFRAEAPATILCMPRRDFFRVTIPATTPLKCHIPKAGEDGRALTAEVVNMSGGGLCLALPRGLAWEKKQEHVGCRMELPEIGTVTVTLEVCDLFTVSRRFSGKQARAGCRFVGMSNQTAAQISRYVMAVEIERKAQEAKLADEVELAGK